MKLILKPVKTERMNLYAKDDVVYLDGSVDMQNPVGLLEPFFTDLHNDIMHYGYRVVTFDITGLTFINSSGIRMLLMWLIKITKLPRDDRYDVILRINPLVSGQDSISKSLALIYQGVRTVGVK